MILISLMLLAAYSFACLSLGLVLLRCFVGRESLRADHAPSARVAMGFVLGSGVLASVWMGVSLVPCGWFRLPVVAGLAVLAALAGAVPAVRALAEVVRQFALAIENTFRRHWLWGVLALAVLALPLLYTLAAALPPRGDAVAFYFAFPKLLAYQGELCLLPGFEFFSQVGLQGEMHIAVLMLFGSAQAGTLLAGFLGVPTAMLLIEIARRVGVGAPGRWTLLILTYTSSAFVWLTFAGRLDLFGVAASLAAVYVVLCPPLRRGMLLLVGVLGCLGVIGKATYALTTIPMLAMLLAWRTVVSDKTGRGVPAVVRVWAWCLLGTVVAVLPHVAKNIVLYGPEYALAPFVAPSNGYDWSASKICSDSSALHILRIYPLAVFLGQFPGMGGTMTVAALALWPAVLLLPRPNRFADSTLVQVSVAGILGLAVFALVTPWQFSLRYFLPALLLLLLAPAAAADYIWNSPKVRYILKVGVAVVLIMALAERFNRPKGHTGDAWNYILGRAEEVDVSDSSTRMFHAADSVVPPGSRVFLATRCVYSLRAELIARSSQSEERRAIGTERSPEERWRKLYREGFRYIYFEAPVAGNLLTRETGFQTYPEYGGLDSRRLPEEFELIRLYWGPSDEVQPIPFATYELRLRNIP